MSTADGAPPDAARSPEAHPLAARAGVPRELLTFAGIGLVALFVDMAALWVALEGLGLGFYAGRAFSYIVAATFTWWMNRTFTFKDTDRRGALRQWLRFLGANLVGGSVNYGVYAVIVTWGHGLIPPALTALDSFLPYAATAAGSLSGLVLNFTASKLFVFKRV